MIPHIGAVSHGVFFNQHNRNFAVRLSIKKGLLKGRKNIIQLLLFGALFKFNACCWEEGADFNWEILNNSSDTIYIKGAKTKPIPAGY
jgi:hypothetical protein